jgi:hypothetical protein
MNIIAIAFFALTTSLTCSLASDKETIEASSDSSLKIFKTSLGKEVNLDYIVTAFQNGYKNLYPDVADNKSFWVIRFSEVLGQEIKQATYRASNIVEVAMNDDLDYGPSVFITFYKNDATALLKQYREHYKSFF